MADTVALEQLSESELAERHRGLQQDVRNEKRAIAAHRDRLHVAATSLTQLEEHCQRLGIRLVVVPNTRPKA
jgi:FtsZ-binding cell division protein ZapB